MFLSKRFHNLRIFWNCHVAKVEEDGMMRVFTGLVLAGTLATAVMAQQAQEITFFSNEGYSGARFTVTGARTILELPFVPRSAQLAGGGTWEICPNRDYGGSCERIGENQRQLGVMAIRSLKPVTTVAEGGWSEIARLDVRDRIDRDQAAIRSSDLWRQVRLCAERNPVRVRRAEVQLGNGNWQRMFVPLVIMPGKCSDGIDLTGGARRVRAVRFDYEAWTAGVARGTISVQALPQVERQPR
jgi:hypothetical protein